MRVERQGWLEAEKKRQEAAAKREAERLAEAEKKRWGGEA